MKNFTAPVKVKGPRTKGQKGNQAGMDNRSVVTSRNKVKKPEIGGNSQKSNPGPLTSSLDPDITSVQQNPMKKPSISLPGHGQNTIIYPLFFRNIVNLHNAQSEKGPNSEIEVEEIPSLTLQLKQMLTSLSLRNKSISSRHELLHDLKTTLRVIFPSCKIYPFGSFLTGLEDPTSDVDVFLDAYNSINDGDVPRNSDLYKILNKCVEPLRKATMVNEETLLFTRVKPVRYARVPIIRLTHGNGVRCDLSFDNLIARRNSQLILLYTKLNLVVRPILLIVRYWARYHHLTPATVEGKCSTGIKNYALIWMVLLFLAHKKIVPAPCDLNALKRMERRKRGEAVNPDVVDGWDTEFLDDVGKIGEYFPGSTCSSRHGKRDAAHLGESVLELLQGFFDFYANIDYSTQMLCPWTGSVLPKKDFKGRKFNHLPQSLLGYKIWTRTLRGEDASDYFMVDAPLCVQDPFFLSYNITECTSAENLLKFQIACQDSAEITEKSIAEFEDRYYQSTDEEEEETSANRHKMKLPKWLRKEKLYDKYCKYEFPEEEEFLRKYDRKARQKVLRKDCCNPTPNPM